MALEKKEKEPESRYIRVGLIGATGAGKTTFGKLLRKHWGANLIEEDFEENPFLEDFYEDPMAWAFHSEISFTGMKFERLNQVNDQIIENVQIVDPDYLMEPIYKDAQVRMGWYDKRDSQTYDTLFNQLKGQKERVPTDIIVSVNAPFEVLKERVEKRGREFEKQMLNDYPEYLEFLGEEVDRWVEEEIGVPVVKIDSSKWDFARDANEIIEVLKEVDNEVYRHLVTEKGLIGSDGKRIKLPDSILSLRRHVTDTVPVSAVENEKFAET